MAYPGGDRCQKTKSPLDWRALLFTYIGTSHFGGIASQIRLISQQVVLLQPLFTKLQHFHLYVLSFISLFVVPLKLAQMTKR